MELMSETRVMDLSNHRLNNFYKVGKSKYQIRDVGMFADWAM